MTCLDFIVVAVYMAAMCAAGVFLRTKSSGHGEYFLAGKRMGAVPVGLSMMVTSFTAVNFIAFPGEVYKFGLYVLASLPVFFIAAWIISKFWIPVISKHCTVSLYELIETRYDIRVRMLASVLFILWRLTWMSTALYASASMLSQLTGIDAGIAILLSGAVSLFYTSSGGMRAVMWTDVIQSFVLFAGIIAASAFAIGKCGGISEAFYYALDSGRLMPVIPFDPEFFSFDPTVRITLWSALIGVSVSFLARYGADQMVVQRMLSAKNKKTAVRGIWINACASVLSLFTLALLGIASFSFISKNAEFPSVSIDQKAFTEVLSEIIQKLPSGFAGLVISAMFAATMSSIDSGINSCCASYTADLHKRFFPGHKTPSPHLMSACVGAAITLIALFAVPVMMKDNTLFTYVNKFINSLGSPILAIIILSLFPRGTNSAGVFLGGICGTVIGFAVSVTVNGISLQYYSVASLIITIALCMVCSAFFNNRKSRELH